LEEHKDKIPQDIYDEVKNEINTLTELTQGDDGQAITDQIDRVQNALKKVGEHVYRQAQNEQAQNEDQSGADDQTADQENQEEGEENKEKKDN